MFEIGTDGISGLVVGFDGSDPSCDALAFSAGVARRNQVTLTVVYVVESTGSAVTTLAPGAVGALLAEEQAAVEATRADIERELTGRDVAWDFVAARGDPATVLEQIADERRIDVIVVGRSRSRLHRRIGSIPSRLMRTAQRPIAVVP
ncbi:MAG TPA: universal stress protein [Acidimicrobiales bacterium]|nr:universal stress protein [Acidimicrobiales bacterium]